MKCPECGAFYSEEDEFCGECGFRLRIETPPIESPNPPRGEDRAPIARKPARRSPAPPPVAPQPSRSVSKLPLILGVVVMLLLCLGIGAAMFMPGIMERSEVDSTGAVPAIGELLYQEDFRDPDSGWDEWDDYLTSGKYVDGEYRLAVVPEKYIVWSHPAPDRKFKDFAVEVDARQIQGSLDGYFGLIVRHDVDKERYYWFQISGSGHYWVDKMWEGERIALKEGEAPDAVKTGLDATNQIQVICYRDRFRFSVNGTLVTELTDDSLRTGVVGLAVGTGIEPPVVVLFDNLRMYALED